MALSPPEAPYAGTDRETNAPDSVFLFAYARNADGQCICRGNGQCGLRGRCGSWAAPWTRTQAAAAWGGGVEAAVSAAALATSTLVSLGTIVAHLAHVTLALRGAVSGACAALADTAVRWAPWAAART